MSTHPFRRTMKSLEAAMETEPPPSALRRFFMNFPFPVLRGPSLDRSVYRFSSLEEVRRKQQELAACMLNEVVQTASEKEDDQNDKTQPPDDTMYA